MRECGAKRDVESERAVHRLIARRASDGEAGKAIRLTVILRRRCELPCDTLLSEHRFNIKVLKDAVVRAGER